MQENPTSPDPAEAKKSEDVPVKETTVTEPVPVKETTTVVEPAAPSEG